MLKLLFFIFHGDKDAIIPLDLSEQLYKVSKSKDKHFKTYPGVYHAIQAEPMELLSPILDEIYNWIMERV